MKSNRISTCAAVVAAALLCVSTTRVNAMAVNWGISGYTALTLADGTTGVPDGDYVGLGMFKNDMSNAAITALDANPTAIMDNFIAWKSDVVGNDGFGGNLGVVGAFAAVNTMGPGSGFFTSNAFLVVANNANPLLATQIGVFRGPLTVSGVYGYPWLFPASDTTPTTTFSIDDLSAPNVLIGGFSTFTYDDNTANGATGWFGLGANSLKLAVVPVPEPATFALVGMGLLGAWGFRRHRPQA